MSAIRVAAFLAATLLLGSHALAQDKALELPPPSLSSLLRLAGAAIDKPPVPVPAVELPASPEPLAELPPVRPIAGVGARYDALYRPVATLVTPRGFACNPLGSVLRVTSQLFDCGKVRLLRGELAEAEENLQAVVQSASDPAMAREARYWLAQTQLRRGRADQADQHLAVVAREAQRDLLGAYAAHERGWIMLERGDAAGALGVFDALGGASVPPELGPSIRHGRAVALYLLKRYGEARDGWLALLRSNPPRGLETEIGLWLGDTLGRLGDAMGAVARVQTSPVTASNPYADQVLMRLGWWRRAAGQPVDAARTYRSLLTTYPRTPDELWARAGLVLSLVDAGDAAGARQEARVLETRDRSGALAQPVQLAVARGFVERGKHEEARALAQELLARNLEPAMRTYVLLLGGEAQRRGGQASEARGAFELVRGAPGRPEVGAYAALRLAQMDLEGRDFSQARATADGIVTEPVPASLKAAALIVAGEAAYWARDYDRAAAAYGRFLTEFPGAPEAGPASLALAWTELRRGKLDVARQLATRFGQERRSDPRAPGALMLAAELAAGAGDARAAATLFGEVIARYPEDPQAHVAVLNRAILAVRDARSADALRELTAVLARSPQSPYVGRMRLARGILLVDAGRSFEAVSEFRLAAQHGEDAARIGLGRVAFDRRLWEEATREFTAARDSGLGPEVRVAEYGIAAVLWNQGKRAEFKKAVEPLLQGAPDPATAPALLRTLATAEADDKRWAEARAAALRLVSAYGSSDAAPAGLAAVGGAALRDKQWPLAREMYQTLADRYASSEAARESQLDLGETLLRTGAAAEARRRLEAFVASAPRDSRTARALLLLAEAREATGDRRGAVEAYARLGKEYPGQLGETGALSQARVLVSEKRWDEARPILERALDSADPAVASEAAYHLGQGFSAAGQHQDAVDAYMTAAYLAPDSPTGRRALFAAGQSFTALKQNAPAVIVYRKLTTANGVEPELLESARKELQALGAG